MEKFSKPRAEEIRLKALYRDYVLRENVRLPIEAVKGLIGHDCAYHLYRLASDKKQKP